MRTPWMFCCWIAAGCGAGFDPEANATALVTRGLGLGWRDLNHRISKWKVALSPEGDAQPSKVSAGYVGGDWTTGDQFLSDAPWVVWLGTEITSRPEVVGFGRQAIDVEIDSPGTAEGSLNLDRRALALLGYDSIVAAIEGLELSTDVPQSQAYPSDYDPRFGYTSRGIGAAVSVDDLTDSTFSLRYRVRFEHGTSDRHDMNAAIPLARTRARLHVLLIGIGDGVATRYEVEYGMSYPPPVALVKQLQPHMPREQRLRTMDAKTPGFLALAGFDFGLRPVEAPNAGYYIRSMTVTASVSEGDEGLMLDVDGHASTSGLIEFFALRTQFTSDWVWIEGEVETRLLGIRRDFETGAAEFSLE